LYIEPLLTVAKIIGSSGNNDSLHFHSKFCTCDNDLYKLLSVMMIFTAVLHLATYK